MQKTHSQITGSFDDLWDAKFDALRESIVSDLTKNIAAIFNARTTSVQDDTQWLRPAAAREFLGMKSRNFWKKLRQTGEVHYTKIGREFQYDKQSLIDYKTKRSTMRYQLGSSKKIK